MEEQRAESLENRWELFIRRFHCTSSSAEQFRLFIKDNRLVRFSAIYDILLLDERPCVLALSPAQRKIEKKMRAMDQCDFAKKPLS